MTRPSGSVTRSTSGDPRTDRAFGNEAIVEGNLYLPTSPSRLQ
jgi:hypothetical protein